MMVEKLNPNYASTSVTQPRPPDRTDLLKGTCVEKRPCQMCATSGQGFFFGGGGDCGSARFKGCVK